MTEEPEPRPDPPRHGGAMAQLARWVGLVGLLGVGGLYLFSILVAPLWGVGVLWLIYISIVVAVFRIWRLRPWLVLASPLVAYLLWAGFLLAGQLLFGWSA